MACGRRVLVWDFPAPSRKMPRQPAECSIAVRVWPFFSPCEFVKPGKSIAHRRWIADRYSVERIPTGRFRVLQFRRPDRNSPSLFRRVRFRAPAAMRDISENEVVLPEKPGLGIRMWAMKRGPSGLAKYCDRSGLMSSPKQRSAAQDLRRDQISLGAPAGQRLFQDRVASVAHGRERARCQAPELRKRRQGWG